MGYFKDVVKGISWLGALKAVSRFIGLGKTAFLARILVPAQFGLFGIASLFLELLEILTETGINTVLIQEKDDMDSFVSTAFIVSVIRGILISLIILIFAPFVAHFFKSPEAIKLINLMAIVPAIRAFINPSIVKLVKELTFKKEFLFRFGIVCFETLVALVAAYFTHSAASLIYGLIAGALLEVALSYLVIKPLPRLTFEKDKFITIVNRGKWMTGAGIFNYFFFNLDDIVVGRLLGSYLLGLYQVGYRISTLPVTEVSDVFAKVTFPVYVKIADDKARLKKALLKTIFVIAGVTVPFGALIYLFSEEVILVVLGPTWLGAAEVLKVLAVFGVLKAVTNTVFSVLLSLKKQNYVTLITFAGILGLSATIIPLVTRFGIVGAGYSAIIGALIAIPAALYSLNKALAN